MARDLLFHALEVCTAHRLLYNARHQGKSDAEIAIAEAGVNKLYQTFDFPEIVRHLAWAESNLAEAEHARYGGLEERRQEVGIATSIRDKARAIRDEIRDAVVNGGVTVTTNDPADLDPEIAARIERKAKLTAADIADCTPTRNLPDVAPDADAV